MNEDFEEFFALLNPHGVEFLVVGGVAYNYHAPPRATKDIGRAPNRVDVLTRPDGLVWDEAWRRRINVAYGTTPIGLLSITDLIESKRAAGRPRDLADLAMLEKIVAREQPR